MKHIFRLLILFFLIATSAWAVETPRWSFGPFDEDATATSYTAHYDIDGDGYEAGTDGIGVETDSEVRVYQKWMVHNADTADTLFCDFNSTSGTQNTAVNDETKSTSVPIPAGGTFTYRTLGGSPRSTISCICTAAQTCSNVVIWAGEP